jgi:colanic acid biosynthesis glycosyl transferase WcaI
MRIGFISQYFDPEPASVFSLDFVKRLEKRGFDIDGVLTSFPAYPGGKIYPGWKQAWKRTETVEGLKIIRTPQWPTQSPSIGPRVATYGSFAATSSLHAHVLRQSDAVYVYQPPTSAIGAVFLNPMIRRKPVVLHVQDLWPDALLAVRSGSKPSKTFDLATRAITKACMRSYDRADVIIAITNSYKHELVNRGVPEEKVCTIYNWANERYFMPNERTGVSPFPISEGRKIVMFAGNAGPAQGLDRICQVVSEVSKEYPISLAVVGAGTESPRLKAKFSQSNSNIHFMPTRNREEMANLYAWTDFSLVALSDNELMNPTLPSKFQASLASGVPVLAVGGGELLSLGGNPKAGLAAPASDLEQIAETFRRASLLTRSELDVMGIRALEAYRESFSQESGLDLVERCLRLIRK